MCAKTKAENQQRTATEICTNLIEYVCTHRVYCVRYVSRCMCKMHTRFVFLICDIFIVFDTIVYFVRDSYCFCSAGFFYCCFFYFFFEDKTKLRTDLHCYHFVYDSFQNFQLHFGQKSNNQRQKIGYLFVPIQSVKSDGKIRGKESVPRIWCMFWSFCHIIFNMK